ncbi:PhzF family phenazine biosynthesis protein [Catalinimonas alkaloidigena]|uniref:PhzF family phenazine biosynthesis protein n=1 Tax=Catalinimonas alkaloidigena TaxID=1075417 RepID=UPI0024055741|nr:PhzF family phenazine biosynthesis protein [Catalinimonas alkaloidigena]MDF9798757.1 PhzF family phenazine biosynthesis protein [Catalinimonas alkaloidigena]
MMNEPIIITQIDAFTDKLFGGNPAAICITSAPLEDSLMQQIAIEMNLSETAFLVKKDKGFHLRWFTPANEVELCGHATLASAYLLWDMGLLSSDETAVFYTLSGELRASKEHDKIVLNFPATPAQAIAQEEIKALFDTEIKFLGKNDYDYLVVLENVEEVRRLKPDFNRMAEIDCRGIIVSASSTHSDYDIISRFFAPACGINEDPVTGSAHCTLAPYWSEILGKKMLKAHQASARGGDLELEYLGERVKLKGKAVAVMQGELFLSQ